MSGETKGGHGPWRGCGYYHVDGGWYETLEEIGAVSCCINDGQCGDEQVGLCPDCAKNLIAERDKLKEQYRELSEAIDVLLAVWLQAKPKQQQKGDQDNGDNDGNDV